MITASTEAPTGYRLVSERGDEYSLQKGKKYAYGAKNGVNGIKYFNSMGGWEGQTVTLSDQLFGHSNDTETQYLFEKLPIETTVTPTNTQQQGTQQQGTQNTPQDTPEATSNTKKLLIAGGIGLVAFFVGRAIYKKMKAKPTTRKKTLSGVKKKKPVKTIKYSM